MSGARHIATCTICGGVEAVLTDLTSHYFGGYYHVRIQVLADVPVLPEAFAGQPEYEDALRRLGTPLRFHRVLEKMAVPEQMIEAVRADLTASFYANVLPYLEREDFITRFARSEYLKALKSGSRSLR